MTAASTSEKVRLDVSVDNRRCLLYGVCQHEAPETFQLRADGRLDYASAVAANEVARVLQAARLCPTQAIDVREI